MISKCLLLDKQSKCPAYFSNMKGVDVGNFCGYSYSHCISLPSIMMFLNGFLVRLLINYNFVADYLVRDPFKLE